MDTMESKCTTLDTYTTRSWRRYTWTCPNGSPGDAHGRSWLMTCLSLHTIHGRLLLPKDKTRKILPYMGPSEDSLYKVAIEYLEIMLLFPVEKPLGRQMIDCADPLVPDARSSPFVLTKHPPKHCLTQHRLPSSYWSYRVYM